MLSLRFAPSVRVFLICALTLCVPGAARAQKPATPTPARAGRDTLTLDGDGWRGAIDPPGSGGESDWSQKFLSAAAPLRIPETPHFTQAVMEGRWREFEVPARWRGQTVRLQFGAVWGRAEVFLNGQAIGSNLSLPLPFEINITKSLHFGAKNLLALRLVHFRSDGHNQPLGIGQSVTLVAHDEAYLQEAFPQAGRAGNIAVPVTLLNGSDHSGDAQLDAHIFDPKTPRKFVLQSSQNLHLSAGRNVTILTMNARKNSFALWTPQNPQWYVLDFNFHQGADSLDTLQVPFGFREWGVKDGAITLNGEAIRFKPAVYPASNLTLLTDAAAITALRAGFAKYRAAGVNLLYVTMPDPLLLQVADETGMVIIERPRSLPATSSDEMRGLILRDRAHPSILGWNFAATDRSGAALSRALDPTRFLLIGSSENGQVIPPNQDQPVALPFP